MLFHKNANNKMVKKLKARKRRKNIEEKYKVMYKTLENNQKIV